MKTREECRSIEDVRAAIDSLADQVFLGDLNLFVRQYARR